MDYHAHGKKRIAFPLPVPLSFDRVNEGRAPRSKCLLFKLPFEILGMILQHVEHASLASLALVNQDCRQWARSIQFASILLKPSQSRLRLLNLLTMENYERQGVATLSPSLSVCLRRIKVVVHHPEWYHQTENEHEHEDWWDENLDNILSERREARDIYGEDYLPVVQSILSSRRLLPHLEGLELQSKDWIPPSIFNALTQSSIQHLKLSGLYLQEDFAIRLPGTHWPLRSLYLEFERRPGLAHWSEHNATTLSASILRLCASTLESLTWITRVCMGKNSFAVDGLNSGPVFPRLRNLILNGIEFRDSSMLDAFLAISPRKLSLWSRDG